MDVGWYIIKKLYTTKEVIVVATTRPMSNDSTNSKSLSRNI